MGKPTSAVGKSMLKGATSAAGLLCLAFAITAPVCVGQGRVSDFLTVQNWHGTVTITGTGSGSTSGGIYSDVWQYGVTTKINFQLDTYDPRIQGWTGSFGGTSAVSAKDVASYSGCNQTSTQDFNGPIGGPGTTLALVLQGTNSYAFYPYVYQWDGGTNNTSFDCVPGNLGGPVPVKFSPVLSDKIQTLPDTGFHLTGSLQTTMDSPMQPMSVPFGGSPAQIQVTITWDIQPGLQAPVEVVVQKTAEFENWRPTAGSKGTRGDVLHLTAKLQAKGGGPTNDTAAYFIWELTQCSKEPGYAMNAPLDSPSREFDLKIEAGADPLIPLDTLGQKAQTQAGQLTQSTVIIAPYDWGAFGKVKVTAVMPDQSQIDGYLEGDTSQTEVRLPMRSDNSLIADSWKKAHPEIQGLADLTDNETDPNGDGNPGDGLTLYEEYRGFIVNGQHEEGNPTKKDYFIVNAAGESYLGGLKLFQAVSGLAVHYKLKQTEMPLSRVINPNHDAGAHIVDQHGVLVAAIAADAGYARAIGGPGPPKAIQQVVTPKILPGAADEWIQYLASSLAHELFHACNVYHHGDVGYPLVIWERQSSSGLVIENGSTPVNILDESGGSNARLLPLDTEFKVCLGVAGGDPHTGDDNCIMRYDDARGYYPKGHPANHRIYFVPREPEGLTLCTTAVGSGVNDPARTPQPRYGDAVPGRGKCRGQVLVNDKVAAPTR